MTSEICNAVSERLNLDWACQETDYSGRGEEVLSTLRGSEHELDGLMPLSVAALPSLGPAEGLLPLLEGAAPALPWLAVAAAGAYGTYALGKELLGGAAPFTLGPALGGWHEGVPIQAADPWILAHPADQPGWAHTLFPGDVVNQASATITPVFQGVGPVEYDGMSLAGVNNGAWVYANRSNVDGPVLQASELGKSLATFPGLLNSPLTVRQFGPTHVIVVASGRDAAQALEAQRLNAGPLREKYGKVAEPVGGIHRIVDDVDPALTGAAPDQMGLVWRPRGLVGVTANGLEYVGGPDAVIDSKYVSQHTVSDLSKIRVAAHGAATLPSLDSGFVLTSRGSADLVPTGESVPYSFEAYIDFIQRVSWIESRVQAKLKYKR